MKFPVLDVSSISFSYGQRSVLCDISFPVYKGQILSLIGPNGSGKSTLLRCLSAILTVQTGSINLNSKDVVH